MHVSLGKELMTYLMQHYTSYFISPEAHANTTQEEAVIKFNSFKIHKTCSRQALVVHSKSSPNLIAYICENQKLSQMCVYVLF